MLSHITISKNGNVKFRPKSLCKHLGSTIMFSRLEGRYGRGCKNRNCKAHPGLCIEDWRCKQITCKEYERT